MDQILPFNKDRFSKLTETYGTDSIDALVNLVYTTVGSNAQSHIKGIASELKFKELILTLPVVTGISKVPDNDYKRRYDFEVIINDRIITFEVKTAKPDGGCDVNFRDQREYIHQGQAFRTHLRRTIECFDFLAVNLVNVTGKWNDIGIVPFSEIPKASTKNKKKYGGFSPEALKEIEESYLAGSVNLNNVKTYTVYDLPLLVKP